MMKFKEIELKYRADDIRLDRFQDFCKSRSPSEYLYVSGYDNFYSVPHSTDRFVRHRVGMDFNQLTFKSKTTLKNNYIRTENNITLGKEVTPEQVEGICESFGYLYNSSIFKTIFVYSYTRYVLSYYIVYNKNAEEQGRFIEIEMSEDYPWDTEEQAWAALISLEAEAKVLGVSARARVKKSLFELYGEES